MSATKSKHLAGLNEAQARAVRHTEGPLLVLAGAGTGKTRVVTCRIAELLARGVAPGAICAVTFTNKAAREMRERVAGLLRGADLDGMVVSTFHSLGLRILREFGHLMGLPDRLNVADSGDQESILRDALREVGLGRDVMHPRDARFRLSGWKNAGIFPDAALEMAEEGPEELLALAYTRYDEELRRRRLLDFDDLILRPLELFDRSGEALEALRQRWSHLLVDEYQDTNGCQYRLIRHLAGGERNLCVVGDDDQSIYAWRGAEPKYILGFKKDFHDAEVVTLEENYRSTARILEAANTVIANNSGRFPKRLIANSGSGVPITLYMASDEKDEMDFVASRLMRFNTEEGIKWEDFAVLFRANSQCRPLEQALRAREIPYRVVGTRSFFDRREVRDLLAYLRLAYSAHDDAAFMRIVNTPPRGIGKGSVDKLARWAGEHRISLFEALQRHADELPTRVRDGARDLVEVIEGIEKNATEKGPAFAMEWLVERTLYRAHLKQIAEDPIDLQKRDAAIEELVTGAREHVERGRKATLEGLLDALALQTDERRDRKGEELPAVTLLTMHAAKGLEFPVVFIVGIEEGICPHERTVREEEEDPTAAGIEEERRLFYVAVTRARRVLLMTLARRRRRFGAEVEREVSRFVEEVGMDTLEVIDTADETPSSPENAGAWLARIRQQFKSSGAEGDG